MWQETFIEALASRDKFEKQYDTLIKPFQTAARRAISSEQGRSLGTVTDEQLEKKIAALYTELSTKTDKLAVQEETLRKLTLNHDRLQQEARLHITKAQNYQDEKQVRTEAVQQLQDEILALQIELNASEQKTAKLEAENVALVDRWMTKIAEEAEMMNKAMENSAN